MAGLCRIYGLTFAEVRGLRLWEVDVLVKEAEMDAAYAQLPAHG